MELIDGDIAKNIWGFFLEFDDDSESASTLVKLPLYPFFTEGGSNRSNNTNGHGSNSLESRIDFRSIRSLRAVNKSFYNAFEEFCGWSRCAVAIKREYRNLKSDRSWNLESWAQALWQPTSGSTSPPPRDWTTEQRRQVGFIVSRAMERRRLSQLRCNQLIRMLDCGPFTKDEKLVTNTKVIVVQ